MRYNPLPLILNHVGIKIACLFLAIFLWLYVINETTMKRNLHIPIKVEIPSQMTITSINTKSIFIGVEGERKAVLKAKPEDFSLIIDMREENMPGIYTQAILQDNIKTPSNINVIYASPSNIIVTLKKR